MHNGILQYITWVVRGERRQERSDERANGYRAHSVPLWICQWINWASVGLVHRSVLKKGDRTMKLLGMLILVDELCIP